MSAETEAPPELGSDALNLATAATASAGAVEPTSIASFKNANSHITTTPPTKLKNSKTVAYDKRWLDNLNLLKPCIKEDGTMDYSSLDEDTQKRMLNFVKDQRKCNRKRENNEPTSLTEERFKLLSEAGFIFKPSVINKAKREKEKGERIKAKELAKEHAKVSGQSNLQLKEAKTVKLVETTNLAKKKPSSKDISGDGSKFLERKNCETPASVTTEHSAVKMSVSNSPKLTNNFSKSGLKVPSPTTTSVRKKSGKPTYLEMAHDAIVILKDRTGSSIPAISKWILTNNEHIKSANSNIFKNRLSAAIKQGVREGRFAKVKNSYKINPEWTKKQKAAARAKEAAKKKAEKQRLKEQEKARHHKKMEMDKRKAAEEKRRAAEEQNCMEMKMSEEEKLRQAESKKRKEEAEAQKKYIEQQLRKRRYPMEDSRLHKEDKEWGVKSPDHVTKCPILPYTLTCVIPPHLRANMPKKSWGSVANASASGNVMLLGGANEHGLITDAIHVYHFYCGDVGLADVDHPIPKFTIKTLFYALDEVMNGNAKAAKSLPPLLTHLFVVALRMLTAPKPNEGDSDGSSLADMGPVELRLQKDLAKLRDGLNAVSWSQICFFYIDLMERYYTSDISLEDGVLAGERKLDMRYFWDKDYKEEDDMGTELKNEKGNELSLNSYSTYLGDPQGVLARGYLKLQSQVEPWSLEADELMALLRALTDDILAKQPDLSDDIAGRGAKLHELFKAKRAATVKFNKVRLAYEGPKKLSRQRKPHDSENKANEKKGDVSVVDLEEQIEKPFEPTATRQQLVAAEKSHSRAVEAYENGLNRLISRTEPMCFDRNFNPIYFFRQDPTMLHIEHIKQSSVLTEMKSFGPELTPYSSWHFIDTKPLFEQFLASLDDRGEREDEALKLCSNLSILKRRLQDEKKENTRVGAREREKEELERRLVNARSACDAEDGRRSGRLAGMAQVELLKVEEEISKMTKMHEEEERQEKIGREKASDYSSLTGLQMMIDLLSTQRSTRSSKKSDDEAQTETALLANVPSHNLWKEKSTGGNGTIHMLVEALFAVEEKCNDLCPWARQDMTRNAWRKQLIDVSCAWAVDCAMKLGPSADAAQGDNSNEDHNDYGSPTKKHKVQLSSSTPLASIVTTIKLCLKDLELRVFEISGRKKAIEEADRAAEIEDVSSDEEDDEELSQACRSVQNCWKIKINALKRIPSSRYGLIRDIIVAAITASRKSHLSQIAAELKAALQLHHPSAAAQAKSAAIQILEKYGGYDGSYDDDFDELAATNGNDTNTKDEDGTEIASLLCDEVRIISGSVGGDDFADKYDWGTAIKDCKSVSRLAVMLQSFLSKAEDVLSQVKEERNILDSILGINSKRTSRTKSSIKKHDSSTAIWCNVKLTEKLVKAKVRGFPWWPAHVCVSIDLVVAKALEGSGYALISSVGNPGMFMVAQEDMVDFAEEPEEDLSQYEKSILDELHASMAIAKKLWRIRNQGMASPWRKKSRPHYVEEKKTSH